MKMNPIKSNILTFAFSTASVLFGGKVAAQHGIDNPPEPVSKIRNIEAKTQMDGGERTGYGFWVDAQEYEDPSWQTVWENQGTYILNDGGRSVPRYDAYIKKNMYLTESKELRRPGGDLSLEKVMANQDTQEISFHYGAWHVRNTQTPAKRKPGQRPTYFERGQFVTQYTVVYQDTNGDMVIDPKVDTKMRETLVVRTPHAVKDQNRVVNRTTFMHVENASTPYMATFGDYFSDKNDMLLAVPGEYPTNRAVDLMFATGDVVENYMKEEVNQSSMFGLDGAREFGENVSDLIEHSDNMAAGQQPVQDNKRRNSPRR